MTDPPRTRSLPENDWEQQKDRIHELYIVQDKRLEGQDGVMDAMEKLSFSATYSTSASLNSDRC
jgi:hypothetical protein